MPRGRILIVEDDPSVSRVLERIFTRTGLSVSVASNGREAIGLLTEDRFDGMITDMNMPRLGGRALCDELRERGPYLPAFIFVVTSRSGPEERQWIQEIPNAQLVEKPVSPKHLLRLVNDRLAMMGSEPDDREKAA